MTRTLFIFVLTLGGFVPEVMGQEPATPKGAPRPGSGEPFNPMGDTSRFTRLGGWGGFGGMIGQFGLAKAMLVTNPSIQLELKLTETQKVDLGEWESQMRKRGETMFRGGGANPGQPPEAGANDPPPPGPPPGFNPLAMMDTISSLVREGEGGLAKVLDKKQLTRLNQIALQMEGIAALGRDEVAEAVYLTPEQTQSVKDVLAETKNNQLAFVMQQGMAMRMRRPTPTPAPTADAKAKTDADPVDPEEAKTKARAAGRERMQTQVAKMRDGTDKIQDESTTKVLKILTRKQKDRFDKLLGPPFDPAKFVTPGAFGGPRPAETAKAKPAATPAKSTRLRDARGSSNDQ